MKSRYSKILNTYKKSTSHEPGQLENFSALLSTLENIPEDILFISIGCALPIVDQQLPDFLIEIAKNNNVRAILIDGEFEDKGHFEIQDKTFVGAFEDAHAHLIEKRSGAHNHCYQSKSPLKLNVELFSCYLPQIDGAFYSYLESTLKKVLDKKGRVFIANHTQLWSLGFIPGIASTYNSLKTNHENASYLQLYTQGSNALVRYYLDNRYDSTSSEMPSDYPMLANSNLSPEQECELFLEAFRPKMKEFYICPFISDLASIPAFTAEFTPNQSCLTKGLLQRNSFFGVGVKLNEDDKLNSEHALQMAF